MRFAPVFLLTALLALPASAQSSTDEGQWITLEGPFDLCTHYDTDKEFEGINRLRESAEAKGLTQTATFQVTYTGFSAQAQAAFQHAVDIWAAHLQSSVPIRVQASFEALGTNILGGASAGRIHAFASGAGVVPFTWYGSPLADALANQDLCGTGTSCAGAPDITARFSSNRSDWYFGTDGNPPAGRFDFVSVVLHELGHGLGFFGSLSRDDGIQTTGNVMECTGNAGDFCHSFVGFTTQDYPVIFDRFVEDVNGVSILDAATYPNPSGTNGPLGVLVRSQNLYWDSPTVLTTNQNQRPRIHAPNPWDVGSSYSHWAESQFAPGNPNALMTPTITQGESYLNPGPATCALMKDIGWVLGPGCNSLVVADEPGPVATTGLQIEPAGPNPFRQSTALRVRLGEPQALRATLHDALGREVAVLHNGSAAGTVTLPISGDLAPGAYTVLVTTEVDRATASLVRVR